MNFPELVALMVLGTDEPDSLIGVVRTVDPESGDWTHRVWRNGELCRRESMDGRVLGIVGQSIRWARYQGDEEFTAFPRSTSSFAPIGGLDPGGERPSFSRWDGTDFTRPAGPVEPTEFLGRPAWQVELAPPAHKPYPIQLTVDAATGLVLRNANRDFGRVSEWTELEIGVDLPDELFVWDGPAKPPRDHEAEHEAEMAERQAWLDAHGIVLDVPLRVTPMLHDWNDETGAFQLSFDERADGSLVRQPLDEPSGEALNYPYMYRWTDSRWAWALGVDEPIADEQLTLLKVQLAKST